MSQRAVQRADSHASPQWRLRQAMLFWRLKGRAKLGKRKIYTGSTLALMTRSGSWVSWFALKQTLPLVHSWSAICAQHAKLLATSGNVVVFANLRAPNALDSPLAMR